MLGRLLLLVAIALAPAIAIQAYMVVELKRERSVELHGEALRSSAAAAVELERVIEGVRDVLVAVASTATVRGFQPEACSAYVRTLQPSFPNLVALAVLDAEGRVVCHKDTPPTASFAGRDYFRGAVAANDFTVGTYLVGQVNQTKVLPLAYPVRDAEGRPAGVVAAALDLARLSRALEERVLPSGGSITIADRGGVVIARAPYADRFVGTRIPDEFRHLVNAPAPGTLEVTSQDGTRRILGYQPVGAASRGLYVSAGLAIGPAMAALDRAETRGFALIATGVVLAVLAAALGGHYFLERPLRDLLRATRRWLDRDFVSAPPARGVPVDLARLGTAFNRLAAALSERERERDAAEVALRHANESLEQAVAARTADLEHSNRQLSDSNRRLAAEIAERQQAEEALRQAQKIEAIGQLTGGVAHDFNNLLTAVLGNLELLRRHEMPAEASRRLVNAMRAAERGARLTEQLLAFARKQNLALRAIDVNGVVAGMEDLLQRTIGGTVSIETALDPDLWAAIGDPNQIELVILNLAINARDAMPDGGALRIETTNVSIAGPWSGLDLVPGDYVAIAVIDSGSGMSPEVLGKVFEPFFTTKGPGKGSGLGLSQAWGVAKQSGGSVQIRSAPGAGTAVKVLLPRARQLPQEAAAPVSGAAPGRATLSVLLVDDDDDVRELTQSALEEMGHRVRPAAGGEIAVEMLRTGDRPDLMIVDFAMPGVNGAAVAAAARRRWADLPILFLTGYAEADILGDWRERARILQKPFRLAELDEAVEQTARQRTSGPGTS